MTAVAFTTIAQPNPGGVLFVKIPESIVADAKRAETRAARIPKIVAQVRVKARAASTQ